MLSPWQYIPDQIMEDERRRQEADDWAQQQRSKLADEWSRIQRENTQSIYDEALASLGPWATMKEPMDYAPPGLGTEPTIPAPSIPRLQDVVAGPSEAPTSIGELLGKTGELLGQGLGTVGQGLDWEQKNIQYPALEVAQRASELGGGPRSLKEPGAISSAVAAPGAAFLPEIIMEAIRKSQGPGELSKSYTERPEDYPSQKGIVEGLTDLLNLVPMGKGAKEVAKIPKLAETVMAGTKQIPKLAEAARPTLAGERGVVNLPETGKPFAALLYHGKGTPSKAGFVSDPGDLGVGEYWTTSQGTAKSYGTVESAMKAFSNPLVLDEKSATALVEKYGTVQGSTAERLKGAAQLTEDVRKAGYDAIVAQGWDSPPGYYTVVEFGKEAAPATKRFYHGTGAAFDVPQGAKFDPNGLYGPGYYLTDSPVVAGSYAKQSKAKDIAYRDLMDIERQLTPSERLNPTNELVKKRDQVLERLNMLDKEGPNVRAIEVPAGLKLLDVEAPLDNGVLAAITKVMRDRGIWTKTQEPKNFVPFTKLNMSGDDLLARLGVYAPEGEKKSWVNAFLKEAGYDGIRYQGGKRIPMLDAAGKPIEHEAVVIFQESLSKIKNAISGTEGGMIPLGLARDIGTSAVGAATGYDPTKPLQESLPGMALRGGLGLAGGRLLTGVLKGSKPSLPTGGSWLPTVPPNLDILKGAYNPDWVRKATDKLNNPITNTIAQVLGEPKNDVFTQGTILRESVLADWKSGVTGAMARLRQLGSSTEVFKVDKQGMAQVGGQKVAINDLLEYPGKYNLSPAQQAWTTSIQKLMDDGLATMTSEGIPIKQLDLGPGGHYVARRILGKLDDEGNIVIAKIAQPGKRSGVRAGVKMGFENERAFTTEAEAIKAGWRYIPPEEATQIYLQGVGRKVADKRLVDFVKSGIPQVKGGETIGAPAFKSLKFGAEDAQKLRKMLDMGTPSSARGLAESISWLNALPRMLMTTFDLGPALIQGQIALFSHPVVWTKAFGRSMEALGSEKGYQSFLAAHADTVKKWSSEGAIFHRSEFTSTIEQGGLLSKIPVLREAAQPFARSFEGLLNAAKVYGLEATEHMAKTPQDRVGLAKFWNEMTGQVETAKMGIGPTGRAIETAILFAPRYRRAVLALMTDIFKGGLRGQMARDALGKATVAGLAAYVGIAKMMGQEPRLDPREGGKFLTVEIEGQNIGLGGTYYSTGRAMMQMALNPEKTPEIAWKYVRNSLSPVVGTIERRAEFPFLFDTHLKLTKQILAGNLAPIWAQAWLVDNQQGGGGIASTLAEMAGGRAFPEQGGTTETVQGVPKRKSIPGSQVPSRQSVPKRRLP